MIGYAPLGARAPLLTEHCLGAEGQTTPCVWVHCDLKTLNRTTVCFK